MHRRCSEKYVLNGHPTYTGCYVCEEWKAFDNFKKWFDANWKPGYVLDKDILVPGNREYGPRTCAYIPQEINKLLLKHDSHRGDAPLGVSKDGKGWSAIIHRYGKTCHVGYFTSPEEAHAAYLVAKCEHIKKVASANLSEGKIGAAVHVGLLRHAELYRFGKVGP